MLIVTICLFALAALLGLYLLSFMLQHKNTPKGIAFLHGPLAAVGLILLIILGIIRDSSLLISVFIFIIAALMGIIVIYKDLTGKSLPKWMAVAHGLTAIIGFIFLIFFAFYS